MLDAPVRRPSVESVFITPELDLRPCTPRDHVRDKQAILDLAQRMADDPEGVLPLFVDLALEVAGGVAAGLSLYEADPSPGVFRWRYLQGSLAPFEDALTPRDFSPCGVTLDQNAPVLSLHPERVYDWIADAGIEVPEVLLVPLYLGGEDPMGTLWIVSAEEGRFTRAHAESLTELASFVGLALKVVRSEQVARLALVEQELLAREMNHRVKNLFAVSDGLIRMGVRGKSTKAEMAEALSGRLHALASAHTLVSPKLSDVGSKAQVSNIETLAAAIMRPHEAAPEEAARFTLEGPEVPCGGRATTALALALHELATNALKYGALSSSAGRVAISWAIDDGWLALRWAERGGPAVVSAPAPQSASFGTTLVRSTIVAQFGGELHYDWRPEGVEVTMRLPLERLAE